jgi:hypothetical protein
MSEMSDQIDWNFAGEADAKAEIGAAVRYLLRDAYGSKRGDIVQEIIEIVRGVADGLVLSQQDTLAPKQPAISGIAYKAYVIDAFQRDTDRWRATIRRQDGKKIRIASPPSVLDQAMTSADALTAEKAAESSRKTIDAGGLI